MIEADNPRIGQVDFTRYEDKGQSKGTDPKGSGLHEDVLKILSTEESHGCEGKKDDRDDEGKRRPVIINDLFWSYWLFLHSLSHP